MLSQQYTLPYNTIIELDGKGGGTITSDIGIDVIEALLLAQAIAGIDVSSPAYWAGVETALEAYWNHNDD